VEAPLSNTQSNLIGIASDRVDCQATIAIPLCDRRTTNVRLLRPSARYAAAVRISGRRQRADQQRRR
jgi:hypothetical protein